MRISLVSLFFFCVFLGKGQCYFFTDTGTGGLEISNSLVETSDGSIYVVGTQGNGPYGNDDMALLKFDSCGNVLWSKFYGDTLSNQFLFINKTAKEELIAIGVTENLQNYNDIIFQKMDTAGNVLLQKKYATALNQSAKYIEQTSDKGFIFCGLIADAFGSNDSYVVKIDSLGIVQWTKQFGGNLNEYADAVHETSDGNYIMTGDANSYGAGNYDVEIMKLDKNGNTIWDYTYGDNLANGCQGIIELSNGKYLSYGETNIASSVAFDFFTQLIDTNGNAHTRYTFGGTAADAIFSMTELPNFEFICSGYSRSYNGFSATDIILFKVDTVGDIKWLKNIYSTGPDIGYQLVPSVKGGYLITGYLASNAGDYVLIRSDTIANTPVGINALAEEKNKLYPNPCNDLFIVDVAQPARMELINMLGEKIKTKVLVAGKNIVKTDDLPIGIYTIILMSDSELISTKKILISR